MTKHIVPNFASLITLGALAATGCGGAPEETDTVEFDQVESALSKSCAPEVDPALKVPDGNKLAFALDAFGYQVYVCQASGTSFGWTLQAPDATLYNAKGKEVGTHYVGPTWEYKDGSSVVGARLAGYTPDTTAIPWLLLQATAHTGSGKLAPVTYIQRLDTVGGLAPSATTCTAENVGELAPIEYSAVYYYFVSGNPPCGCH